MSWPKLSINGASGGASFLRRVKELITTGDLTATFTRDNFGWTDLDAKRWKPQEVDKREWFWERRNFGGIHTHIVTYLVVGGIKRMRSRWIHEVASLMSKSLRFCFMSGSTLGACRPMISWREIKTYEKTFMTYRKIKTRIVRQDNNQDS